MHVLLTPTLRYFPFYIYDSAKNLSFLPCRVLKGASFWFFSVTHTLEILNVSSSNRPIFNCHSLCFLMGRSFLSLLIFQGLRRNKQF